MEHFRISPAKWDPIQEMSKLVVVVPSYRPEQVSSFRDRWVTPELPVRFVHVHDSPTLLDAPGGLDHDCTTHVCWADADRMLGDSAWIISRRTDAVRSLGFLVAAEMGASYVCSIDDDCKPPPGGVAEVRRFWESHLAPLCRGMSPTFSTTGDREWARPRGLPRPDEDLSETSVPVVINHGLWDGVMDRSGRDELEVTDGGNVPVPLDRFDSETTVVPKGFFYPMCGMNVCFRIEMLPSMYFGLQGHIVERDGSLSKLRYDRYGDIWAGMVSKMVADDLGLSVTSGPPNVMHDRQSNSHVNADKERHGLVLHPKLLRDIFDVVSRWTPVGSRHGRQDAVAVATVVREISSLLSCTGLEGYDQDEIDYLNMWSTALDGWVGFSVR